MEGGVDEHLDGDAEDAEGGEVEAYCWGREAETACEVEEGFAVVVCGGRGCGEEDREDVHEGCVVEGEEREGDESVKDLFCPGGSEVLLCR